MNPSSLTNFLFNFFSFCKNEFCKPEENFKDSDLNLAWQAGNLRKSRDRPRNQSQALTVTLETRWALAAIVVVGGGGCGDVVAVAVSAIKGELLLTRRTWAWPKIVSNATLPAAMSKDQSKTVSAESGRKRVFGWLDAETHSDAKMSQKSFNLFNFFPTDRHWQQKSDHKVVEVTFFWFQPEKFGAKRDRRNFPAHTYVTKIFKTDDFCSMVFSIPFKISRAKFSWTSATVSSKLNCC